MTLDNILVQLAAMHAAADQLADLPLTTSPVIGELEVSLMVQFTTAQSVLWDMAPQWFKDASYDGGLYGTDLAGDPSLWAPDDVAELCAMLAIAAL